MRRIFTVSLALAASIMAVGTAVSLGFAEKLIGLFTENPSTVDIGAHALRLISIGFLISSVSVVISGALEALGEGPASLCISLLRYIVVVIPLAFMLSRFIGSDGVWHAIWLTEFITAGAAAILYRYMTARRARRRGTK